MAGKQIKIFKIVNGYRKASVVDLIETFKVTFLGSPNTIRYEINGRNYNYNEVVDLETGEYDYRAYSPNSNYIEETGRFTVSGGDALIAVDLKTQLRAVRFIAEDTSGNRINIADISIDSKFLGVTDSLGEYTTSLSIGDHTISANKELYLFLSQSFTIPAGTGEFSKVLIFSPVVDLTKGYAFLSSTPQGATVKINGVPQSGLTPINIELQEGPYSVSIEKQGYNPYASSIVISRGKNTTVNAILKEISTTGNTTFTANKEGVVLTVNGSVEGSLPITVKKPGGVYSYVASKSGFFDYSGQFVVSNGNNTSIYVQMTEVPVTTDPPIKPEGTILSTFCNGYDKYNSVSDGLGGAYDVLVEKNALYCGAPQTSSVTIQTNEKAIVTVYDETGLFAFSTQSVDTGRLYPSGIYQTEPQVLKIGRKYKIYASYVKTDTYVLATDYGPYEDTFVVQNRQSETLNIRLPELERQKRIVRYFFTFTEWSYNINGNTNGTGGIVADTVGGSVTASIRLLEDLIGPGDGRGNSKGIMRYEILDANTGYSVYKSPDNVVNFYNPWVTDTYELPLGSRNILFEDANVVRSWRKASGSNSTDATWTGATTFKWRAEAYQFLTWKDAGTLEVKIDLPFSYTK